MSDWLDQAESNIASVDDDHSKQEEKFLKKQEAIRENYQANKVLFDSFITDLKKLVERVNKLPAEHRQPFGKLGFHFKDSKLDNQLHYFSSSTKVKKRMYKNIFHLFKTYTFKRVRVAYLTVSSQQGMINVELKENMLLRVRLTRSGEHERLKDPRRRNKDRKNYRFSLELQNMNGTEPREIIDWLAFRKEMKDIHLI